MVREANGQSKLSFSQVFWTLVLAMTLSHNFLKCENMCKTFSEPLFSVRRHLFTIIRSSNFFVSDIFSAVLFGDRIYTLDFLSRWQWSTIISAIAAIRNSSSTFPFCFSAAAFSVDYLFSQAGDFSSQLPFSSLSTIVIRFNKNIFCFLQKSHSQQVHEPAYKQSIIPMCLQVAQEAYC